MRVIMEYEEFVVIESGEKYFVIDNIDEKICFKEVECKYKMKTEDWEDEHPGEYVVDFDCRYSGQSDDLEWVLGFDLKGE